MEIRQAIPTNQHVQNILKINSNICNKYNEIFYFYEAKSINEIMFNQKNSLVNSRFKEAMLCKDEYQFLKRYYFLASQSSKKQIQDRIKMLTEFYSTCNKTSYDYHTINFTSIKSIFDERNKKINKKTAADDTQNQIIRRRNYKTNQQQTASFHLFDDYDIVSISNKSQYIKSDLKHNFYPSNESSFSEYIQTYNVYENQNQIKIPIIISVAFNSNDITNSVNHLVCDFADVDQDMIIKQYQNIQLKRRKRNQGITLSHKKNRTSPQPNFPDISIKPQKSPKYEKSISKQKNYLNNYDFGMKEQIGPNITGTRDTKQYQNQLRQFSSWKNTIYNNQKTQNNDLFYSNAETLINKSSQKNYKNKQIIQKSPKKYCLNLNTKQVFLKYKHAGFSHYRANTQALIHIPNQQRIVKKLNDRIQAVTFASDYPIKEQSNDQIKFINSNNQQLSHSQSQSKYKYKNTKFSPHLDQMPPKIYTFQKQQNSAKSSKFSTHKFINPFIIQTSNKVNNYKIQQVQTKNLLFKNKCTFEPQQTQQQRNLITNKYASQFNLPIERYSKQKYSDNQSKQLDLLKRKIQKLKEIKINHQLSRK